MKPSERYRHPDQILQDRAEMWKFYRRGMSQREIAAQFQLHQATVSRELKAVRTALKKEMQREIEVWRLEQLDKLDHLELTYWEAWERSVGTAKVETIRAKDSGDRMQGEKTIRTETLAGDPAFLQGVERCLKQRAELLGLNAPVKQAHQFDEEFSGALNKIVRAVYGSEATDHTGE